MKTVVKQWSEVQILIDDPDDIKGDVDVALNLLKEMHRHSNCLSHMWIKNNIVSYIHPQIRTKYIFHQEILVPDLSATNASILEEFGYAVIKDTLLTSLYTTKQHRKKNYTKILL